MPNRIGVVSDTHNNLVNVRDIVALFNDAGVSRVVHTGDITRAKTLDVLAGLEMPLYGVFGNNDVERESLNAAADAHGFTLCEPPLWLDWDGRRIVVVHDPRDFRLTGEEHLALHGHTHMFRCEWDARTLVFNPGECAGHMKGYNAVGVVDLDTLETSRLKF